MSSFKYTIWIHMTNLEFSSTTQVLRGVDRAGAEGVEGEWENGWEGELWVKCQINDK